MFTKFTNEDLETNQTNHTHNFNAKKKPARFSKPVAEGTKRTFTKRTFAYPYGLDADEENSYQKEQLAYHASHSQQHVPETTVNGSAESSTRQRLSKIIAGSGYCARRKAERLILDGRITVDGVTIDNVSYKLDLQQFQNLKERVLLDGAEFLEELEPTARLWIMHKPRACLVTKKTTEERQTIFDLLPAEMAKIVSVGRLDYNTSGLLLLTNSGRLANYLSSPANAIERIYKVKVFGNLNQDKLNAIQHGVTIRGERYIAKEIAIEENSDPNSWLRITMQEGKNREIRKLMQYCGLQVTKLIRISFGEFNINDLEPGTWKEIDPAKVALLMQQVSKASHK